MIAENSHLTTIAIEHEDSHQSVLLEKELPSSNNHLDLK